jgi:glycosyltransferase involved in cell wall biosynthesis
MTIKFLYPNPAQPGWLVKDSPPRNSTRNKTAAETGRPVNGSAPAATVARSHDPAPAGLMRILLWHWGRIGAGPKFTFELARALGNLPHVAISVSASDGSDLDALCRASDVALDRVHTFGMRKGTARGRAAAAFGLLGLRSLATDFSKALAGRRPDVALCAFQSIWDVAAIQALRRFSGRFVLVLHDASFHPGDDYPFRSKVLACEIAAADGLIVLSEHVAREAAVRYGFPQDRIWIVPHGSFSFGGTRRSLRRHPRHRAVKILFLGRILDYKGLGLLIEAYRLLRLRQIDVTLNIAGEGDMEPYANALAGLAGVDVDNRWLDDIEIANCLARADIVVLPYVEASQSGVAAAAMTEALPLVVTPVGGLAEQVAHEKTGLVASAVEAGAVAAAIERLVVDSLLYERCSQGALRHAQSELSWAAIAEKVLTAVEDIAQRPPRSAK